MSPQKPKRTRQSTELTREQLLDTAHQLINERGHSDAIDIKVKDVVEAAGYTIGAAYQIWPTQKQFQEDVAVHISERTDWADTTVIMEQIEDVLAAGPTFEEMVRRASTIYAEFMLQREDFFTALTFFAVRDRRPDLTAAISAGYDLVHDSFVEMYEGLLALYGREMRAGFVIDDLVASSTAVAEGMLLRHRVQPERLRSDIDVAETDGHWHVFGTALMALVAHYTVDVDST